MQTINSFVRLKWALREVTSSNRMKEAYTIIGIWALLLALLGKTFLPFVFGAGLAAFMTMVFTLWLWVSSYGRQEFEKERVSVDRLAS